MQIRTSQSHPIQVNWVQSPPGTRIGLTFAPGKHASSMIGDYAWARDLGADLDRLVAEFGANVLACLVEDHELVAHRIPDLVAQAEARGLDVRRFPIPDGGVPASEAALRAFVDGLATEARAGRTVIIHCRGGLGRTGTIGGCLLVALGVAPADALAAVQAARGPLCPESPAQRGVVLGYGLLSIIE